VSAWIRNYIQTSEWWLGHHISEVERCSLFSCRTFISPVPSSMGRRRMSFHIFLGATNGFITIRHKLPVLTLASRALVLRQSSGLALSSICCHSHESWLKHIPLPHISQKFKLYGCKYYLCPWWSNIQCNSSSRKGTLCVFCYCQWTRCYQLIFTFSYVAAFYMERRCKFTGDFYGPSLNNASDRPLSSLGWRGTGALKAHTDRLIESCLQGW